MKVFRDISTIGLGDIIGSGITALFWFYLASILDPSEYGQIHYLISIAIITSTFTVLGTQNVLVVYIAKNKDVVLTLLNLSLAAGIIILIISTVTFDMFSVGLLVLGIIIFTYGISRNLAKKEFKKYSTYTILQKSLTAGLALLAYNYFGIEGIIYGIALSYFVYLKYIIEDAKNTKLSYNQLKIHINELKIHKNFILTNYFLMITNSVTNQVDKLLIVPILGFALLGNYSLGLQIITMLTILPGIIFKFALTSHAIDGKISKNLKSNSILLSFVFVFIGVVIAPIVIPIYFQKYNEVVDIIQIMSFSIIPITISLFYYAKFLGLENGKIPLYGGIISSSIMISGMIVLGTIFEAKGIAITHVLSYSSLCLFYYLINKKIDRQIS